MSTVADLIHAVDRRFPLHRAEPWDKVGLQVGDSTAAVSSVFVTYELTEANLGAATEHDAVLVYHPLLFRPLESLDYGQPQVRLAAALIASNTAVVSVHTALDGAPPPGALGDALAAQLGLGEVRVLQPSGQEPLVNLVTYVPPEKVDQVCAALWNAGAGKIGRYDEASFRSQGTGTFRPLTGARPRVGQLGEREETDEWRVEVVARESIWPRLVQVLRENHPYEEVAFSVLRLLNPEAGQGYGPARLGTIEPVPLEEFAARTGAALNSPSLRVVEVKAKTAVSHIACSPGSGASFIEAAARAGADCLVTGDIKHHDALKAQALKLCVIDVTHTATERPAVGLMADALHEMRTVTVTRDEVDRNPFGTSRTETGSLSTP